MEIVLYILATTLSVLLLFSTRSCRLHKETTLELNDKLQKANELIRELEVKESKASTLSNERNLSIENLSITIADLRKQNSKLIEENAILKNSLSMKETTIEKINSQHLQDLENTRKTLISEFKLLTTELLKSNSKEFAESSKEKIEQLLSPFKTKIENFERSIQISQNAATQERSSLNANIKSIVESNTNLANKADQLNKALKGDIQRQGAWGELVLETVLKSSGLRKGFEYIIHGEGLDLQNAEGQRQQPDIIINLPDDKHLIIDSKSSFPHYHDYLSAETETEKTDSLKKLIASIQSHVKALSEKKYHFSEALNTPDLTLMFIPIEAMFSLVVEAQKNIFEDAWKKSIIIVSPANLLAILRTVESIWKVERQNRNAQEIANEGGRLHDKFVDLLSNLEDLKTSLNKAMKNHDDAMRKLQGDGNIIKKVQRLKELGLKTKKSIPAKYLQNQEEADEITNQIDYDTNPTSPEEDLSNLFL